MLLMKEILQRAIEILKKNEKAGFVMPDSGYYEGAWLWDMGFIEMGEACLDAEKAAQRLLNFIKKSQDDNGLIPHILFFSEKTENYFPGPDVWQHGLTSGITQPPVLGFCALSIYENLKEKSSQKAEDFLKRIYPLLLNYHRFLFLKRDAENSGLVSIYHPWESGLDNSPRWEEPLSKIIVTSEQVEEAKNSRRDIVDKKIAEMRPTNEDYAKYLYLIKSIRKKEFPFNVKDVLFNSILYASNEALLSMAYEMGRESPEIGEIKGWLHSQRKGLKNLYDEASGLYFDFDVRANKLIKRKTIASFSPLFAGIVNNEQAQKMANILRGAEFKGANSLFLIPSVARSDRSFHPLAYWRGPVWFPVNWLVLRGFERLGLNKEAFQIKKALLDLVNKKGFWEYYNPNTNEGLGRRDFSWTAALVIDLIKNS